jgi:hypothetical protein
MFSRSRVMSFFACSFFTACASAGSRISLSSHWNCRSTAMKSSRVSAASTAVRIPRAASENSGLQRLPWCAENEADSRTAGAEPVASAGVSTGLPPLAAFLAIDARSIAPEEARKIALGQG